MTRTLKILIGVVVILIAVFAVVGSTRASEAPQLVHVNLKDSQVDVSQFVVVAGRPVKFEVANGGTLSHHLVVRSIATDENAADVPVIGSHSVRTIELALAPGVYRLYCDLMDHAERGMVSAIAAEKTPRASFPIPVQASISLLVLVLGCTLIVGDSLGIHLMQTGDR